MSKIGLLTNRTRAEQRPPLLPKQVSADLLAHVLPVVKRPKLTPPRQAQAQIKARTEQPVRRKPVAARGGAPGAGQYTPQNSPANGTNGRPLNGSSLNGKSTNGQRPDGITPANPVPSSTSNGSPKPGFGSRPTANPPSQARNGTPNSGQPSALQREEHKPSRPVQMPLESPAKAPADLNRREVTHSPNTPPGTSSSYPHGARPYPSEPPKPTANQPHSERSQPSSIPSHIPNAQAKQTPKQPERPQAAQTALLTALKQIFNQQPDLPAHAAVLGIGDDGFPVLLDVFDPAPGALVVIGDERKEQLAMLRSAVASLAMRATPRTVQVMIISCEPDSWREWMRERGFERFSVGIEGVDDMDSLQEWILRFGDWIEQRRLGQRSGPPILLVMDTLSFLPRLSHDIRLNFEWMVKEGPAAQIWPLAAVSSELAQLLSGRHLLRSFPTRVLGFVDRPDFYEQFAGLTPPAAQEFAQPGVFAVQVGEEWLRLRLAGR